MDEIEYLRTRAILLIIAKTVGELDLEGFLKCIERVEGEVGKAPSVFPLGPLDPNSLKKIARGALLFQNALPPKEDGHDPGEKRRT